jgi:hypothetical protein
MRRTTPAVVTDEQLGAIFGADIACARAVLDHLGTDVQRAWSVDEIRAATGHRLVDVMVAVARLTTAGLIDHPSAGRYCSKVLPARLAG